VGVALAKREAIKMLPLSLAMNWYIYNSIMLLCFSFPYLALFFGEKQKGK